MGVVRLAGFVDEHVAGVGPRLAERQALLQLHGAVLTHGGDRGWGEQDLALALRLRRRHHDLVVGVGALLHHGERPSIEIDVFPAKPGQFAAAHAGVQGEDPERGEAIVADVAEEGGRLAARPHRQLHLFDARGPGAAGRIDRDQVPSLELQV